MWQWSIVKDAEHEYHNDPDVVSVTETLCCLRAAYFDRAVDYAEEPKRLLARCNGAALHEARAEAAVPMYRLLGEDVAAESKFMRFLDGERRLIGTADWASRAEIRDYKFMQATRKTYDSRHVEQLNIYSQMAGGGHKMIVDQESLKDHAAHEVHEMPDALDRCKERALLLLKACDAEDPKMLDAEGPNVKFFRICQCDFCPHFDACGDGKKTEKK